MKVHFQWELHVVYKNDFRDFIIDRVIAKQTGRFSWEPVSFNFPPIRCLFRGFIFTLFLLPNAIVGPKGVFWGFREKEVWKTPTVKILRTPTEPT